MNDSEALFVQYKVYENGGKVLLMRSLNRHKADFFDLLVIAVCFARLGHEVKVMNSIHYKDPLYIEAFRQLIGTGAIDRHIRKLVMARVTSLHHF